MFVVGQKVVCIANEWGIPTEANGLQGDLPIQNGIYTISEITIFKRDRGQYLRFNEVNVYAYRRLWWGGHKWFDKKVAFEAAFFRPLVSDQTEAFRALVRPIFDRKKVLI